MKALSTTILIVVTAVVILVAALVVLTIFGGGIGNVSTLTNFKTQCIAQCQITCKMGALPPTWGMTVKVQGVGDTSCAAQTGVTGPQCTDVCGEATSTGGGGGTTTCPHTSTSSTPCDNNCPYCANTNDCRKTCPS